MFEPKTAQFAIPQQHRPLMRGTIVRMLRSPITDRLTMLCDVALDNADLQGNQQFGVISNVVILQPGCSSLSSDNPTPPTGMFYVPEEGSRVEVGYDGVSYVVTGYLTGPSRTADSAASSPGDGGATVSNDPGIESSKNFISSESMGDERDLLLGLSPGSSVLGSGNARVKVAAEGAMIGGSLHCMDLYKADHTKLSRATELDVRMLGYYGSHKAFETLEAAGLAHLAAPLTLPAPAAAVVTTALHESTMFPYANKAVLLEQRGHISAGLKPHVRQALLAHHSAGEVTAEETAKKFTISRDLVAQPTPAASAVLGKLGPDELRTTHYSTYERQIDSDGSWFIRAGNKTQLPQGPETSASDAQKLDMSLDYDAKPNVVRIRVAQGGAESALLELDGTKQTITISCSNGVTKINMGPSSGIEATAPSVSVKCSSSVSVQAGGSVTVQSGSSVDVSASSVMVKAASITLLGPTQVVGTLEVTGALTASTIAQLGPPISLAGHTHIGNFGLPTTPPTPGT